MRPSSALLACVVLFATPTHSDQEMAPGGQVQIPLELYNHLLENARHPDQPPRPAPAAYALGNAQVHVTVTGAESRATGEVRVELALQVFEDGWVLIPVLPVGTPVESAVVDGNAVQLLATPDGLAWSTQKAGSHRMSLAYRVDAAPSASGFSLPVPLPQAAAIGLTALLPGTGLDVSVIPAAGIQISPSGANTQVKATVPTANGVQIAWHSPSEEGYALSRALYQGVLTGRAVSWSGELDVELFTGETLSLPLLPRHVTLSRLEVDGKAAPILTEGDLFVTPLKGRGNHKVVLGFEVPVLAADGPPRVEVDVPPVPVSRFDLELPGNKDVTVTPDANVASRRQGDTTVATVNSPMTKRITFSWAEAVPEDVRTEVRVNASLFHAVHAEEGVLAVRAFILYEITRGETNLLSFDVPPGVQVNRVTSPNGAVADWRIEAAEGNEPRTATVFLDRKVSDEMLLEVHYDRSLGPTGEGSQGTRIDLPLLQAPGAHRQRGMVALLSSKDLTLEPVSEGEATRVGENQLPPYVREALTLTVAHTFKYVESPPEIVTEAREPERKQGRFDAQVDTLISLGEVTLSGSSSVEINIKSGRIMALSLAAPEHVNILNLTGPSIRTYEISPSDDRQMVEVEFTQEMEGQFRLEVSYELILVDGDADLAVPTLKVEGAEVEQGRIAVEALSAVEVQSVTSDQLTALDMAELPQQLILRTTNPILLAYKYVHSDPPYRLVLKVTRHRLLDVQEAAIDEAVYRTLFTRDGLAVTTARFTVRNSRKQFLRVLLPKDAEIWSAFVDGRPEKPALAEDDAGQKGRSVLLKIVNSTQGFPVQLIYATPGSRIRGLGSVEGVLPQPDILVTRSMWDVFLPAEMRYRDPSSNMDLVTAGATLGADELRARMGDLQQTQGTPQSLEPLRITVPATGVHFAFEKLYANQSGEDAWISVPYSSAVGATVGIVVSLLGMVLLLAGVVEGLRPVVGVGRRAALGGAALGAFLLLVTVFAWGVSAGPALVLAALGGVGLAGHLGLRSRAQREFSKSAVPPLPRSGKGEGEGAAE